MHQNKEVKALDLNDLAVDSLEISEFVDDKNLESNDVVGKIMSASCTTCVCTCSCCSSL